MKLRMYVLAQSLQVTVEAFVPPALRRNLLATIGEHTRDLTGIESGEN